MNLPLARQGFLSPTKSIFTFTQGQTLLPGMANKGAAKREVENKWTRSQTKFKMALFVVPPQK